MARAASVDRVYSSLTSCASVHMMYIEDVDKIFAALQTALTSNDIETANTMRTALLGDDEAIRAAMAIINK